MTDAPRPPDCQGDRVRTRPAALTASPRAHTIDASPFRHSKRLTTSKEHPDARETRDAPGRPSSPALDVQTDTTAQCVGLITVTGPLDAAGEAQFTSAAELAMTRAYVLVLDLRGLTHCDTAGAHAVLKIDALARAQQRLLVIRPADHTVHRAFEASGATEKLRFVGPGARPAPPH